MTDQMPDEVMDRYGAALALSQRGDRDAGRAAFADLWDEVGRDGDALHRCAVAHAMADVQDDPNDELLWDQRALAAADGVTDGRTSDAGMAATAAALYPSLHLNLGDVHRRLGDADRAREHLALARAALCTLPADGYGDQIREGLDRLADRLDSPAR